MVHLDGSPSEPSQMNEPCPVAECESEAASDAVVALPSILPKKDESFDELIGEHDAANDGPPVAKENGLITLSGLPPAHWKNLFHLELVKERNKPTEAPKKPPSAPFFLQWRSALESSNEDAPDRLHKTGVPSENSASGKETTEDGWDAVWSDDDTESGVKTGKDSGDGLESNDVGQTKSTPQNKRRKVVHDRTKLAELLRACFDARTTAGKGEIYSDVTSYLSKKGPSSIDVEISSLCYGVHDLEEGLPLLHIASMWLLEACESHQSFEAVNAYLHRFLYVHGNVITRMNQTMKEDSVLSEVQGEEEQLKLKEFIEVIAHLREKQKAASNRLQGKMQHTICLLRHLSRMV